MTGLGQLNGCALQSTNLPPDLRHVCIDTHSAKIELFGKFLEDRDDSQLCVSENAVSRFEQFVRFVEVVAGVITIVEVIVVGIVVLSKCTLSGLQQTRKIRANCNQTSDFNLSIVRTTRLFFDNCPRYLDRTDIISKVICGVALHHNTVEKRKIWQIDRIDCLSSESSFRCKLAKRLSCCGSGLAIRALELPSNPIERHASNKGGQSIARDALVAIHPKFSAACRLLDFWEQMFVCLNAGVACLQCKPRSKGADDRKTNRQPIFPKVRHWILPLDLGRQYPLIQPAWLCKHNTVERAP